MHTKEKAYRISPNAGTTKRHWDFPEVVVFFEVPPGGTSFRFGSVPSTGWHRPPLRDGGKPVKGICRRLTERDYEVDDSFMKGFVMILLLSRLVVRFGSGPGGLDSDWIPEKWRGLGFESGTLRTPNQELSISWVLVYNKKIPRFLLGWSQEFSKWFVNGLWATYKWGILGL